MRGALLTRGLESARHGPALVQRPFRRLSVGRRLPCLRKLHEARRSRARRQVAFRMRLQEDQGWYRSLLCARLMRVSVQSSGSAHSLLSRRALMRGKLPAARVVLNANGHTPSRQAVLSALKEVQKRHSLRHYFLSALVRGGANLEAVRELASHSKLLWETPRASPTPRHHPQSRKSPAFGRRGFVFSVSVCRGGQIRRSPLRRALAHARSLHT